MSDEDKRPEDSGEDASAAPGPPATATSSSTAGSHQRRRSGRDGVDGGGIGGNMPR